MFSEVKSIVNEDAKIFHKCFGSNFSVFPGEIFWLFSFFPTNMNCVLASFRVDFLFFIFSEILFSFTRWLFSLKSPKIFVSSANKVISQFLTIVGRSLIYKSKRSGPRTDPWSTPCVVSLISNEFSENWTNCLRLERKERSNRPTVPLRPYLSHLSRSNWCSTVSKAFDKSNNVHWNGLCCCFRSSNDSKVSIFASTVERLLRNPNCLPDNTLCFIRKPIILFCKISQKVCPLLVVRRLGGNFWLHFLVPPYEWVSLFQFSANLGSIPPRCICWKFDYAVLKLLVNQYENPFTDWWNFLLDDMLNTQILITII